MKTGMSVYVAPGMAGSGLFAGRAFVRGERIINITGAVHTGAELDAIGFRPGYPLQVDDDRFMLVDEPFVFCNHSCDPNAGITPELELVAVRAIAPDEELSFDYSTTMLEDNSWTMECGCKTARCRGRVEDFDRLPVADRERLIREVGVLPFIERSMRAREGGA